MKYVMMFQKLMSPSPIDLGYEDFLAGDRTWRKKCLCHIALDVEISSVNGEYLQKMN